MSHALCEAVGTSHSISSGAPEHSTSQTRVCDACLYNTAHHMCCADTPALEPKFETKKTDALLAAMHVTQKQKTTTCVTSTPTGRHRCRQTCMRARAAAAAHSIAGTSKSNTKDDQAHALQCRTGQKLGQVPTTTPSPRGHGSWRLTPKPHSSNNKPTKKEGSSGCNLDVHVVYNSRSIRLARCLLLLQPLLLPVAPATIPSPWPVAALRNDRPANKRIYRHTQALGIAAVVLWAAGATARPPALRATQLPRDVCTVAGYRTCDHPTGLAAQRHTQVVDAGRASAAAGSGTRGLPLVAAEAAPSTDLCICADLGSTHLVSEWNAAAADAAAGAASTAGAATKLMPHRATHRPTRADCPWSTYLSSTLCRPCRHTLPIQALHPGTTARCSTHRLARMATDPRHHTSAEGRADSATTQLRPWGQAHAQLADLSPVAAGRPTRHHLGPTAATPHAGQASRTVPPTTGNSPRRQAHTTRADVAAWTAPVATPGTAGVATKQVVNTHLPWTTQRSRATQPAACHSQQHTRRGQNRHSIHCRCCCCYSYSRCRRRSSRSSTSRCRSF